jgi:hypothetical protein
VVGISFWFGPIHCFFGWSISVRFVVQFQYNYKICHDEFDSMVLVLYGKGYVSYWWQFGLYSNPQLVYSRYKYQVLQFNFEFNLGLLVVCKNCIMVEIFKLI